MIKENYVDIILILFGFYICNIFPLNYIYLIILLKSFIKNCKSDQSILGPFTQEMILFTNDSYIYMNNLYKIFQEYQLDNSIDIYEKIKALHIKND